MPRTRVPRRVAQERSHEGYLVWVQHLLDVDCFAWSEVPSEQADRLVSLLELMSQVQNWSLTSRHDEFEEWCSSNLSSRATLFEYALERAGSSELRAHWDSDRAGWPTEAEAIQACLVALNKLLEVVRRV